MTTGLKAGAEEIVTLKVLKNENAVKNITEVPQLSSCAEFNFLRRVNKHMVREVMRHFLVKRMVTDHLKSVK